MLVDCWRIGKGKRVVSVFMELEVLFGTLVGLNSVVSKPVGQEGRSEGQIS